MYQILMHASKAMLGGWTVDADPKIAALLVASSWIRCPE